MSAKQALCCFPSEGIWTPLTMPIQTISPQFLFFRPSVGPLLVLLAVRKESPTNIIAQAYPLILARGAHTPELRKSTRAAALLQKHNGGWREGGVGGARPKTAPRQYKLAQRVHLAHKVALHRLSKAPTLSRSELMKHDLLQLQISTI